MGRIVVGVDGGGTRTRIAALDVSTNKTVSFSECGSIHTLDHGVGEAAKRLEGGIAALGLSPSDEIAAIAVGDPALDDSDPGAGEPFRSALRDIFGSGCRVYSTSDVFMALYAFSRGKPAALIVSGTGSMGAALIGDLDFKTAPRVVTVGGWGEPSRDPGSGYRVGVDSVSAALDAFDGVGEPTSLCEAALAYFGAASPRDLVGIFNPDPPPRAFIAGFARETERRALAGDAVALRTLKRAGEALGNYAVSLLKRLDPGGLRLGCYGGLVTNCGIVRDAMEARVRESFPGVSVSVPDIPAHIGAALFAADALESEE